MIRIGNTSSYPLFNYSKNWSFIGIWSTMASSLVPIGFGVAGHACFRYLVSFIVWLTVALGLPIWLFVVPWIGLPLIIVAAVIINIEIVRSARWRRQYELCIDRLIRTSTNSGDAFGVDVFG